MLYLNDVIQYRDTQSRLRVVCLDQARDEVWLFNLTGKDAVPERYSLAHVEAELTAGTLYPVPGIAPDQVITPSAAAIVHRDAAYQRIKPLVSNADILIPEMRSALVKARARELGCSPKTIYRDLRIWWRNGQTLNALTPRFHGRGSTGGTTANRGKPPKYQQRGNFQIGEADKKLIREALEKHFLKDDIMTLRGCYQHVLEQHYSYVDGEGQRHIKESGECPSEQQFRRLAKQLLPEETVVRKRKGDAEFELNHRPKLGSLQHETYTVGDAYEIDATIADVFLVSSRNRGAIIGKPTLYLVFDRKSWLIVGFYVGLESPSWPAAMHAIKSIAEDKATLCQRYGLRYDPADWPAHGVFPKEFIADRGEMLSANSTLLADGLSIVVRNLPARRADHKPLVECGFKLLQRSMADAVPGYAPPENFAKRQGKHYDKDACLTLDEFTAIMLANIIRFNRSPREGYKWAAANVLNDLQPIPIDIWNLEIRQRAGALARIPEEQVRFALLPRAQATVTREGIRLGACYYSCPEAISRGWLVAAGRAAFKVTVSYDRRLVDSIYIHDSKDPTNFFVATLLDRCSDYRGLSFQEVEAIEYQREVVRQDGCEISRQHQLEFHESIAPITQKARAEMRLLAKGKSRSSRKKDIVEDREDERRLQRQVEARIPSPAPANAHPAEVIPLVPLRPPLTQTNTTDSEVATVSGQDARRRQKYLEMLDGN